MMRDEQNVSFEAMRSLVYHTRTYRRFNQAERIGLSTLRSLVDLGRMSASGMNKQWLRYGLIHSVEGCSQVYPYLRWAASLPEWGGPAKGERPTGYIVVVEDKEHGAGLPVDAGIASQSIMLGAVAMGYGGTMVSNMDREALGTLLGLKENRMHIALVLALGKVVEEVVVEPMPASGDTRYWREGLVHHVPKRSLEEVILPLKVE